MEAGAEVLEDHLPERKVQNLFSAAFIYSNGPKLRIWVLETQHNLPRICIEMAFSVFLRVLFGFLANVGTRGLRISRNMVWKMLLLFW